jgi:hypothetical protein
VGVCAFLKERWNLSLKYFKFKEVYKEKMINKHVDTDNYITNKSLLKQANHLQRSLNNYLVMM